MDFDDRTEQRPPDSAYFTAVFEEGPLGITFHRAPASDYVYVKGISAGSQAAKSDVVVDDRLWAIDEVVIGTKSVTKESWAEYLSLIKEKPRPLVLVFRRVLFVDEDERTRIQQLDGTPTLATTTIAAPTSTEEANSSCEDGGVAAVQRACSSDLPRTVDNNAELILLNEIRVIASKIIMNAKSIELVTNAASFASNGSGTGGIRKSTGSAPGNHNIIMDFLCVAGRTLEQQGEVYVYRSTGIPAKPKPTPGAPATTGSTMDSLVSGITSIFGSSALANPAIAMLTARNPIGGKRYLHVFNDILLISIPELGPRPANAPAGAEPPIRYQLEAIVDIPTCKLRRGEHSDSDLLSSLYIPCFKDALSPRPATQPAIAAGALAEFYGTTGEGGAGSTGVAAEPAAVYKNQLLELLHPAGVLFLACPTAASRDRWLYALFKCVTACMLQQYGATSSASLPLGWQHQYILGTMHSAVLMRDDRRIEELLKQCEDEDNDADVQDVNVGAGAEGLAAGAGALAAVLEEQDADGYTPLHYACLLRQTSTAQLLLSHFADAAAPDQGVTVSIADWCRADPGEAGYETSRTCRRGWTPMHWAAVQLDFDSLELLGEHVYDRDLVLDNRGRNPLVLACLEGRNARGVSDANSLAKCMACLMDQHTDLNVLVPDASLQRRELDTPPADNADDRSSPGVKINLLHVLASSWEHECCQLLLKFKAKMNCIEGSYPGTRPQKYHPFHGFSPLHVAVCGVNMKYALGEGLVVLNSLLQKRYSPAVMDMCTRMRSGIGAGADPENASSRASVGGKDGVKPYVTKSYLGNNVVDGPDMYENGLLTLEYLLLYGARPNLCSPPPCGPDGPVTSAGGGTALQLLMMHTDKWRDVRLSSQSSPDNYYINKAITLLLSFGARIPTSTSAGDESWVAQLDAFISPLDVDAACAVWSNKPNLDATVCPELDVDSYVEYCCPSIDSVYMKAAAPACGAGAGAGAGVGETGQCQCCQVGYTMFRRAHTCRMCAFSCCDDCSKKKITFASSPKTPHRVCDSCFNRARHSIETADREKRIRNLKFISPIRSTGDAAVSPANSPMGTVAASSSATTAASASASTNDRQTLFAGGNTTGVAATGATGAASATASAAQGTNTTISKLSETHQRLQERGEKLNQVADKSSELANASQEFARMAREMKEQQSRSWF